jgi:sulfoxide reductase heme-binding subunit YedZ
VVIKSRRWQFVLAPLFDRSGRFSFLKSAVLCGCLLPAGVVVWRWATDDSNPQPITDAIDQTGLWTLRFVLVTLAISPLRQLAGWPRVSLVRRMLGVTGMAYAVAHLLLYTLDQKFRWLVVVHEIAVRIYLTIGFVTLLVVCVLGLTSSDWWMKRLGRDWRRLHQAIFVVGVLGILHFFMQSKANVSEAVLMAGYLLWLSIWRTFPITSRATFPALFLLALSCGVGAALIEFAWYALATGVPAMRVLQPNMHLSHGVRPAVWVVFTGLIVATLAGSRPLAISLMGQTSRT